MSVDLDAKAKRYGAFFESLSPATIGDVRSLVTENVRFKDPFNDVRGQEKLIKLLGKMFEDADDISFSMREQIGDGFVYFLRWNFTCRPKSRFLKGSWQVDGISVITLTAEGLIEEHVDYWDAAEQFYERLPMIGSLLRFVRRPLALGE